MNFNPLLDGVAKGDLVFRKGLHDASLYTFDCTLDFYDSMVNPIEGDCAGCRFYNTKSQHCGLPSPSQLKHHIPYLRENYPELFI